MQSCPPTNLLVYVLYGLSLDKLQTIVFFYAYRGIGGLLVVISPFLVGFLLHFPIDLLFADDEYFSEHLWSHGLALFLAGVLTFAIAFRMHYRPQTTEYGTPAEADDSNDSPVLRLMFRRRLLLRPHWRWTRTMETPSMRMITVLITVC